MKIIKNATFEYEKNNINENSGYTKWYEREKNGKKRNLFMIWIRCILFVLLFLSVKDVKIYGWLGFFVIVMLSPTAFFVIMPLRDIIKLGVVSGGKFNENCLLSCWKDPGSVYNGFVTKGKIITSLVMPFLVFVCVLACAMIFTQGELQLFFRFLLIISTFLTFDDLYMLFYCLKHIDKNDIVFGEYKIQK